MIPLLDDKLITKVNFHQCDEKYQRLLENQYRIITGSIDHITAMANNIYNYVVESENKFFIRMCCDFKTLEDAAEKIYCIKAPIRCFFITLMLTLIF